MFVVIFFDEIIFVIKNPVFKTLLIMRIGPIYPKEVSALTILIKYINLYAKRATSQNGKYKQSIVKKQEIDRWTNKKLGEFENTI